MINKDKIIKLWVKGHKTYKAIGDECGVSKQYIHKYCQKNGITIIKKLFDGKKEY